MSTVGVISLGCSKNRVDSERILGCFADAGFTITPNPEEAEVLLVNTCGFITPAKEESINTTLEMAQYKQTGRCMLLVMAGCLSPVIPALIASGLLATVLTIMTLVLHVDASTSSTYSILYNLSQTVFYFMPVLVAYTSAKKFGTEPVLAMVLACFLLYPDWVAGADGSFTHYFGRSCIPLIMAP